MMTVEIGIAASNLTLKASFAHCPYTSQKRRKNVQEKKRIHRGNQARCRLPFTNWNKPSDR
jgi:hypothetical protein